VEILTRNLLEEHQDKNEQETWAKLAPEWIYCILFYGMV
jgi:hypothetical protein